MSADLLSSSKDIDTQLESITKDLKSFVIQYDRDRLAKDLEYISSKKNGSRNSDSIGSLNSKAKREKEYTDQLNICNKLWFINGLLNELRLLDSLSISDSNDDWKMIDLASSLSSFSKLNTKVNELQNELTGSGNGKAQQGIIKIIDDLNEKVKTIEESLLKLIKVTFIEYLEFSDDGLSVKFNSKCDDISIKDFFKSCYNYLLCTTDEYEVEDINISILLNFNKLFGDWVKEILQKLDQDTYKLELAYTDDSVSLKAVQFSEKLDFSNYVQSLENLINFFNMLVEFTTTQKPQENPSLKLKQYVLKPIVKSLENKLFSNESIIYSLILSNLDESNKQTHSTKSQLKILSGVLSQRGWSSSGYSDIELWIDDSITYWITNIKDKAIDDIKKICIDLRLSNIGKSNRFKDIFERQNLISAPYVISAPNTTTSSSDSPTQVSPVVTKDSETDDKVDDGWDNEWNDEWDDLESKKEPEKAAEEKPSTEDDDGWGTWNDEWDDDANEPKTTSNTKKDDTFGVKSLSTSSNTSHEDESVYKISKLPEYIIAIIEDFLKNYETLHKLTGTENSDLKEMFLYEVNKLITSYFILVSFNREYYPDPILFYNDFNYILDTIGSTYQNNLQDCYKLNLKFMHEITNQLSMKLHRLIQPYSDYIFSRESPYETSVIKEKSKELIIRLSNFFTDVFSRYYYDYDSYCINRQSCSSIIAETIYNYHNYILSKIFRKTAIEEEESNILAEFVSESISLSLPSGGPQDILVQNLSKIQTFGKLNQIKIILTSSLKEILDKFYDAAFFDLRTEEIISLIQALFVDSSLRRSVIEEITSLREEGNEE